MPVDSILVRIYGQHSLLNEALATILHKLPEIEVVSNAAPKDEPVLYSVKLFNEVALWILLPSEGGDLFAWIKEHPRARVLLISIGWKDDQIKAALSQGTAGCVYSDASLQELSEAIRQVARDHNYLPSALIKSIIVDETEEQVAINPVHLEILSSREKELIPLICQGMSNKQIAQKLYLSVRTIENHLSNIFKKLNASSRTEVAVYSLQNGWVAMTDLG
jgi:two-component system, NarL family, response regulator DegU